MKRRKKRRRTERLNIERLEDRKLLAADFGLVDSLLAAEVEPPIVQASVDDTAESRVQADGRDGQRGNNDRRGRDRNDRRDRDRDNDNSNGLDRLLDIESRAIDGTGNNTEDPTLGSTHTELNRATTVEYSDGIASPAGEDRVSAREISNTIAEQVTSETNDRNLTDLTWIWGQFIDHDIDLTEGAESGETYDIQVPTGDPYFDPFGTGEETISLTRSNYDPESGTSTDNPRQQVNEITAFLDGSVVYGSDEVRAAELRTFEGGLLKVSEGDLLPFNEAGLGNAGGTSDSLFLAGDVRANENIALTAMHTIWVREHNSIATRMAQADPDLTDEQIYQAAKTIVTAEIQAITFNEFLPSLLGTEALSSYSGYDSTVDPSINNVFSGAAYRFGHSMLPTELLRLNNDGTEASEGNISLQNAFFSTSEITDNGIESVLLGAANQVANEIDNQVVDDIRNFLFGPPGSGGFDLASLNIQRGRDHGLADYNQVREDFGLERVTEFSEISSDPDVAQKLEDLYGTVDNIDVWVGGLAEDHVAGSSVGELFQTVMVDQFERIRDGDRLWYENVFSGQQLDSIQNTTLADVIERNTDITGLRGNVFFEDGGKGPTQFEVANDGTRVRGNNRAVLQDMDRQTPDSASEQVDLRRAIQIRAAMQGLAGVDANQQQRDIVSNDRGRESSTQQRRTTALDNAFEDFDRRNG